MSVQRPQQLAEHVRVPREHPLAHGVVVRQHVPEAHRDRGRALDRLGEDALVRIDVREASGRVAGLQVAHDRREAVRDEHGGRSVEAQGVREVVRVGRGHDAVHVDLMVHLVRRVGGLRLRRHLRFRFRF